MLFRVAEVGSQNSSTILMSCCDSQAVILPRYEYLRTQCMYYSHLVRMNLETYIARKTIAVVG